MTPGRSFDHDFAREFPDTGHVMSPPMRADLIGRVRAAADALSIDVGGRRGQ